MRLFLITLILILFITEDFKKDFKKELNSITEYPQFNSIYWADSIDLHSFRRIDSNLFNKYFNYGNGKIFHSNQNKETEYYILGQLQFEEDFIGLIICFKYSSKGEFGQDAKIIYAQLCIFDLNGSLIFNTEYSQAYYLNDTLFTGGFSKVDIAKNKLTFYSSTSNENYFVETIGSTRHDFEFYGTNENLKNIPIHLK